MINEFKLTVIGVIIIVSLIGGYSTLYLNDFRTIYSIALDANPDLNYVVATQLFESKKDRVHILTPNEESPNGFSRWTIMKDVIIVYDDSYHISAKIFPKISYFRTYGEDKWDTLKRFVTKVDIDIRSDQYSVEVIRKTVYRATSTTTESRTGGILTERFIMPVDGESSMKFDVLWDANDKSPNRNNNLHRITYEFRNINHEFTEVWRNHTIIFEKIQISFFNDLDSIEKFSVEGNKVVLEFKPRLGNVHIDPIIRIGTLAIEYSSIEEYGGKQTVKDFTQFHLLLNVSFNKDFSINQNKVKSLLRHSNDNFVLQKWSVVTAIEIEKEYQKITKEVTGFNNFTDENGTFVSEPIFETKITTEKRKEYLWSENYTFDKNQWKIIDIQVTRKPALGFVSVDIVPKFGIFELSVFVWWNLSFDSKFLITVTNPEIMQATLNLTFNTHYFATDCSDIRFTNSSENEELWSYTELYTDSGWCYPWVNLTQADDFWLYSNNNTFVTTRSNGENTFIMYDDWNTGEEWDAEWNTTIASNNALDGNPFGCPSNTILNGINTGRGFLDDGGASVTQFCIGGKANENNFNFSLGKTMVANLFTNSTNAGCITGTSVDCRQGIIVRSDYVRNGKDTCDSNCLGVWYSYNNAKWTRHNKTSSTQTNVDYQTQSADDTDNRIRIDVNSTHWRLSKNNTGIFENVSLDFDAHNVDFSNVGIPFAWVLWNYDDAGNGRKQLIWDNWWVANFEEDFSTSIGAEQTRAVEQPIIFLNGFTDDRKYEFNTTANITVGNLSTPDSPENVTLYIDGILVANLTLPFQFNYTIPEKRIQQFDDGTNSATISNTNVTINVTQRRNVSEASFNISGTSFTNWTVSNTNKTWSSFYFGTLDGKLHFNDKFTNGLQTEDLSSGSGGTFIRFLNYTVPFRNNNYTFFNNLTIDLFGQGANSESLSFTDRFYNSTFINASMTTASSPSWTYDDYSFNVTDRWDYSSTSGNSGATLWSFNQTTSEINSGIVPSSPNVFIRDRGGPAQNSFGSTLLNFKDFNITDFGETRIEVALKVGCNHFDETAVTSDFGIIDTDNSVRTSIKLVTFSGLCPRDVSDLANWTINKTGTTLSFYREDVLENTFSFTEGKNYDLYLEARGFKIDTSRHGVSEAWFRIINVSGIRGSYDGGGVYSNATFESTILQNFTSTLVSAKLTATDFGNTTDVVYYLSPDGGATFESVTNGQLHTFTASGQNLTYKVDVNFTATINESDGGFIEYPTVADINIEVPTGFPANITIDVGNDGVLNYNRTAELNTSNSPDALNVSGNVISSFIFNNCLGEGSCLIPVVFNIETSGTLNYTNINASETINRVEVNITEINNRIQSNSQFNVTFGSDSGSAILNVWNVSQPDDWNISIVANNSVNATGDSRTIQARYSNYNFTFADVNFPFIVPFGQTSVSQSNVTPFGQNDSTPILNITSDALLDSFNISFTWITTPNSCLNFTISNESTNRGYEDVSITNTSTYFVNNNVTVGSNFGLWTFWNLSSCGTGGVGFSAPIFRLDTICLECIRTNGFEEWTPDPINFGGN